MTWADVLLLDAFTWIESVGVKVCYAEIPKLKALKEKVEKSPKIAEWIKTRPASQL